MTVAAVLRAARWDRWLSLLYVATVLVIAIPKGLAHGDNNFAIFRAAFPHLVSGQTLYATYPHEYSDLYKYSPTFAVLFAPFSLLPWTVALVVWDGLNVLLLVHALRKLLPARAATLVLALLYLEVVRTTQRSQSNALVTALVILAYIALQRRRQLTSSVAIAVGTLVKLFPLAAISLALFHPRRFHFALVFSGVLIALIALPLLFVQPHELVAQYASWQQVEKLDALARAGSGGGGLYGGVMAQFRMWFGVDWPNWPVQLAGTLLLLLPIAVRWRDRSEDEFQLRFLASLLVYMVIFNHQAESPSFVIAVTGIAIWYVSGPRTGLHTALMALTIVIVSLSSTEIMPHRLSETIFIPYHLKTIPCLLAWLVMQAELLASRDAESGQRTEVHELDVAPPESRSHGG